MDFKIHAFACFIVIAFLTGCRSKPQLDKSSPDTLVTVVPDTAIDTVTEILQEELIEPASLSKGFTTLDSIQDFNTTEGIFKNDPLPVDAAVKLYFYAWDYYDEPRIEEGEEFIGLFPQSSQGNLTFYRLDRVRFHYDTTMKHSYPPFVDELDEKWPVFYLKGVQLKNAKGVLFPYTSLAPGSSLAIQLKERKYTFSVEGKAGRIQYPDWAMSFVKNYRLILSETSSAGTIKELLLGRKYMTDPNESDGPSKFIHWAGDLNNDGFIDIISGDAVKVCVTYSLWMGAAQLKFKLITRFSGCGC